MLGDFASLDVQNTYRGSDAYERFKFKWQLIFICCKSVYFLFY
ncbi:hypothetical protein [Piscirickettsia salmonis]|nr:hypothetical protein [Piscirickettsia salmonis]